MQDLTAFLQDHVGRWLCQRSSYYLEVGQDQAGKLEMTVAWLAPESQGVIGTLTTTWQGNLALLSRPYQGNSTLVLLANGQLEIHQERQILSGSYQFLDEALTLTSFQGDFTTQERIWFGGKNLRMRTVNVKRGNGHTMAHYFSEIRVLPPTDS